MNNKCRNCAKFITCDRRSCKKITFVEAGIINRPQLIKSKEESFGITMQECLYLVQKASEEIGKALNEF